VLFLSYAEEDVETALKIADWLVSQDFEVYHWRDPNRRGGRFIRQIGAAIKSADAFLALLSPSFLNSSWCGREVDLAIQREQDLQTSDPDVAFIHVLQIIATPNSDAGFLRSYDWVDLTDAEKKDGALGELARRLGSARENKEVAPGELAIRIAPRKEPGLAASKMTSPSLVSPSFRNRQDELDKVLRGLTIASGPHFWLVIAPPLLGKTWFLRRVSDDPALSGSAGWVTRLVDLRAQPPDVRSDAAALLARLFGLTAPATIGRETLRSIAREISRNGKPHLCLLDSADLLDKQTAATLRSCLSQIYRLVQDAGKTGVRLALIVASRREDEWRGVTPDPRLSPLPLTEFKADVVQQALHDLAVETQRTFSPTSTEFRKNAALVHRLTEGLPALLVLCLQWIQAEEWLGMERLESQELFEELTDPYIREGLLTRDSLLPESQGQADEPLHALEQAYRILAPYRLFTQSHLRHHFESDLAFSTALTGQRWSMADLWRAISGTALLSRPLNEPWQEIHPAIRRLLHRHYYKSNEQRAEAHSEARKFVEIWADKQAGKEQVIGLVECLWHEATVLRLRNRAEMEQRLSESARTLSKALAASSAYTLDELRDYASERMRNDEELEEAVSNVDGLFARLINIVVTPLQES
jgi:TIR domain